MDHPTLFQVVLFVQNQQSQVVKKELVTFIENLVNNGDTIEEILQHVKEQQEKHQVLSVVALDLG